MYGGGGGGGGEAIWERWVASTIALSTSAPEKCSRCYWETRSKVKGQHAPPGNNQRQKYIRRKQITFLRILVVIGRYGPHLMTVMIFVTQNNFETVQEFPTVSLDCTLLLKTKFGYLM